jgi:TRAP-type C4-dicarboxylate transport system substrate-binding protein
MRVTRSTVFSLFLVFLFAVMFLVVGCSTTTTTTATATATTTMTATQTVKATELSVAPGGAAPPPSGGMTNQMIAIADLVQTRTNGLVTLKMYWGQTLVKQNDVVTGIQTDICDVGVISAHAEPGKVPLALVAQQAGVGTDMWARAMAYSDLAQQDPEKSELAKYDIRNLFAVMTTESYIISKVPIRTIDDLKGKKFSASGTQAAILDKLGGTAVAMTPAEQYEALQKGTIDAVVCPTSATSDFKFNELGKYFVHIPFGYRVYPMGINIDVWNKLDPGAQKALTDMGPDVIKIALDAYLQSDAGAIKTMQDYNIEFIDMSAADMTKIMAIESGLADDWAATNGDAGKQILADYRALVDKYEKISPYKK